MSDAVYGLVIVLAGKDDLRSHAEMRTRKNNAYTERNRCVALMAHTALALGVDAGRSRTNIPGWDEKWHGIVYIDLPTGQVSWHFHDDHAPLFASLPEYDGTWDGHDIEEKYRRVHRAATEGGF